jgi:hypothetical protein
MFRRAYEERRRRPPGISATDAIGIFHVRGVHHKLRLDRQTPDRDISTRNSVPAPLACQSGSPVRSLRLGAPRTFAVRSRKENLATRAGGIGNMSKLEDLRQNASVQGILPNYLVTVVNTQWFGSEAVELTYKDPTGKVGNELLYRHDEQRFKIVEEAPNSSSIVLTGSRSISGASIILELAKEANNSQYQVADRPLGATGWPLMFGNQRLVEIDCIPRGDDENE